MKSEFYTESTKMLFFTAFDSSKEMKSNVFRIHHHADLEIGFNFLWHICSEFVELRLLRALLGGGAIRHRFEGLAETVLEKSRRYRA